MLSAALVTSLHYVDTGGSIVKVGVNPLAFHSVVKATLLSFGPVLLITAIAASAFWRARDSRAWLVAALWFSCAFYYFFVDIRDHQDVYVGWRVGHLWFITSAALGAVAYQSLATLPSSWRAAAIAVVAIGVLAAFPTALIDIYNTQDIYNESQAAGFKWTLLLPPDEQAAFAWIRANTPPDALFQTDPLARGVEGWANLPAFAERRLGVGLPISMVPLRKYERGSQQAAWLFETRAESAHALAARNGIQYLFLGAPERTRHPEAQRRFDASPEFFEPVFRNTEVTIYRVK
jgi:uncharacterized membrane protein